MLARARSLAAALSATATVAVLLTAPLGPAAAGDRDPGVPAAAGEHRAERAQQVLAEAADVLGGSPGRRDATLVLRDLALARPDLSATDRAAADRMLARPTDGSADPMGQGYPEGSKPTSSCNARLCVHWATARNDAPDPTDLDLNGRPDYVDRVIAELTSVHDTYVAAGYRAPKPDGTRGGNSKPDVYLADIGWQGLYGYCAVDRMPRADGPQDAPAYCVLDDDYDAGQYGTRHTPTENLQVTAAHEYFHAVQFAYDVTEDAWFMEATATWVEDEVYDDVDDNRVFLRDSPMSQPRIAADAGRELRPYGSWILFRHLTERFPATAGGLPTLVRDAWRKADASRGAPDQYSLQAVRNVLRERGTTLPRAFARFAADNRRPAQTYEEGAAYRAAPPTDVLTLGARATRAGEGRLDHLSSSTTRFRPSSALGAAGWRLRLRVDLGARSTSPAAIVTTYAASGAVLTRTVRLDRAGVGATSVPFSAGDVRHVELTLVNASGRFTCGRGTIYSCAGRPVDDDVLARTRVTTFR